MTPANLPRPFPETILVVHNRYRQFGGEDTMFDAETALLEAHGHRVERFVADNHKIRESPTVVEAIGLAARTVWSPRAARLLRDRVRAVRPDVVHVHNFFPLLSPAIYSACRQQGATVIQTLHNYRLVCPSANLYRDGHPCEDCLGRKVAWPSIVHSCYRDSAAASSAVAAMLALHRVRRTWSNDVDMYIAVSDFLRGKLVEGLIPPELIVTKPNFVQPDPAPASDPTGPFLFVGRLAEDKGIETLIHAWEQLPPTIRLRIVGDGPLGPAARAAAARLPNVEAVGHVPHEAIFDQLHTARALVFPSRWYEGAPVTIMEAFAAGLPVIASKIGAMDGMVIDDVNGFLFQPADAGSLAERVRWLAEHEDDRLRLGAGALATYRERYEPEANYTRLIEVYRLAIARRHRPATEVG